MARTINAHPALFAFVTLETQDPHARGGSDVVAVQGQTPAQARQKIEAAFIQLTDNIAKTKAAIDGGGVGFEALKPVQEKLYGTHPQWSTGFGKAMGRAQVADAGGEKAAGQLLLTLGAAALIIAVEIGSAGAATPLIGALIGLTASGVQAADSWNQWAKLDTASKTAASPGGSVVLPKDAEEAEHDALVDTAFALWTSSPSARRPRRSRPAQVSARSRDLRARSPRARR